LSCRNGTDPSVSYFSYRSVLISAPVAVSQVIKILRDLVSEVIDNSWSGYLDMRASFWSAQASFNFVGITRDRDAAS
jgi:hypothetical protein